MESPNKNAVIAAVLLVSPHGAPWAPYGLVKRTIDNFCEQMAAFGFTRANCQTGPLMKPAANGNRIEDSLMRSLGQVKLPDKDFEKLAHADKAGNKMDAAAELSDALQHALDAVKDRLDNPANDFCGHDECHAERIKAIDALPVPPEFKEKMRQDIIEKFEAARGKDGECHAAIKEKKAAHNEVPQAGETSIPVMLEGIKLDSLKGLGKKGGTKSN